MADSPFLANLIEPWTMSSWIRATMKAAVIAWVIAWTTRMQEKESLVRQSISWIWDWVGHQSRRPRTERYKDIEDDSMESHHANENDLQVYTMPVPNFLSFETEEFDPETYVAPPYATAATSLCWRHDPHEASLLQSNARIVQWEDGSLTLQLASAPKEQYRISTKALAPLDKTGTYDTKLDSHVYLGAAAETSSVFRLSSHLTHGLTVLPTTVETDDAVQRLQESLAAATRGTKKTVDGSAPVIEVKEDPELAKRQAELAEREKLKAARRRQQLADREMDRGRRAGVSGRTGGAGLTVGGLEDDDGLLTSKPRASKPRRMNRRGEINTDDEEDFDRRGRRDDEYDEDDGFLVGSDEEPEVADDDEEEEILEDEDADAEAEDDVPAAKPKRASPEAADEAPTRKKNRYIVDDEEEDE